MKTNKFLNELTIDLTNEEIEKLTRPVNGNGGRQDLMRDIAEGVKKRKKTITLSYDTAQKLVYFKDYGKTGGFQSRISNQITDACRSLIMKKQLLEKSGEAYLLSLEIINKPTIVYRIETFAYLICNAWEMLLKAKLLHDHNNIDVIYRKRGGWSKGLSECRIEVFSDKNSPIALNLKDMGEFRNECTHLNLNIIPSVILSVSQTCITNYHKILNEWFGISLSDKVSPGMMTLTMNFDPKDFDPEDAALRSQLGKDAIDYLIMFQNNVIETIGSLSSFDVPYYCVPIVHTIAKTDKIDDAEIVIGNSGSGSKYEIIVNDDSDKTHPVLMKQLREEIALYTSNKVKITPYQVKCILTLIKANNGGEYFLRKKLSSAPYQYTLLFIDYIKSNIDLDSNFVKNCLDRVRIDKISLSL